MGTKYPIKIGNLEHQTGERLNQTTRRKLGKEIKDFIVGRGYSARVRVD